jgi:uncharacterized membrane protein
VHSYIHIQGGGQDTAVIITSAIAGGVSAILLGLIIVIMIAFTMRQRKQKQRNRGIIIIILLAIVFANMEVIIIQISVPLQHPVTPKSPFSTIVFRVRGVFLHLKPSIHEFGYRNVNTCKKLT